MVSIVQFYQYDYPEDRANALCTHAREFSSAAREQITRKLSEACGPVLEAQGPGWVLCMRSQGQRGVIRTSVRISGLTSDRGSYDFGTVSVRGS